MDKCAHTQSGANGPQHTGGVRSQHVRIVWIRTHACKFVTDLHRPSLSLFLTVACQSIWLKLQAHAAYAFKQALEICMKANACTVTCACICTGPARIRALTFTQTLIPALARAAACRPPHGASGAGSHQMLHSPVWAILCTCISSVFNDLSLYI